MCDPFNAIMEQEFFRCVDIIQQTLIDIDKFQVSTEVLAILGVLECGFPFEVSPLCKNVGLLSKFLRLKNQSTCNWFAVRDKSKVRLEI